MPKNRLLMIIACLAVGLAVGAWLPRAPDVVTDSPGSDAAIIDRLTTLERALDTEREARQLLEDELFELMAELDERPARAGRASRDAARVDAQSPTAVSAAQPRRFRDSASDDDRSARLIQAGFSEDRAAFIARREAELRMQAMQARFEARQQGESVDFTNAAFSAEQMLREELGESDYERYLEANGRPTSIAVSSVLEFSPAEQVGLRRGDQIVRYNGERVFNVFDLNRSQAAVAPDGNVVVDILRDGQPMQVAVPAGPLGITAGRGRVPRIRRE